MEMCLSCGDAVSFLLCKFSKMQLRVISMSFDAWQYPSKKKSQRIEKRILTSQNLLPFKTLE